MTILTTLSFERISRSNTWTWVFFQGSVNLKSTHTTLVPCAFWMPIMLIILPYYVNFHHWDTRPSGASHLRWDKRVKFIPITKSISVPRLWISCIPSRTRYKHDNVLLWPYSDYRQVRLMWPGSLSLPKVLFFLLRYYTMVHGTLSLTRESIPTILDWLLRW